MSKQKYIDTFNKQIKDFFKQITVIYPQLKEIRQIRSQLAGVLLVDKKIAIEHFYNHVVKKYEQQILSQDEEFFLNFDVSGTVLSSLNHLKSVYTSSTDNTKKCIWKYCKVLTLLSKKYATC